MTTLMKIFHKEAHNEGTIEDMRRGAELAFQWLEKRRIRVGGRHGLLDSADMAVALHEVKEDAD